MKRTLMILVAALAFLSAPAFATKPTPQPDPQGPQSTSQAGALGVGIGAGFAASDADAAANALAKQKQAATAVANTEVLVEGDRTQSNTPPVVPGNIPAVPTSCRLYLFGGGATRDGAASGSIPLGNDQTCLSIAKLNLMERAGGFSQKEKQAVVCEVEGMTELQTCKNLTKE